jgi:hypothetical protein
MKFNGNVGFTVFLILICSFVLYSASKWSFKTGFFPMAIAIPLIVVAGAYLILELFGAPEKTSGPAMEAEFSQEVTSGLARRRVIAMFSWIGGFIIVVFLLGFPLAVPLFTFLYLKFQSEVSWIRATALTAAAWGFFYFVFQRLIQLQFEDGVIQAWLGM